jgi:hypothetical protein
LVDSVRNTAPRVLATSRILIIYSGLFFYTFRYTARRVISMYVQLTPPKRSLQWFRPEHQKTFERDVKFYRSLIDSVRQRMASGTQKDCMASRALADPEGSWTENELAYAVSAPFGAGVHTVC